MFVSKVLYYKLESFALLNSQVATIKNYSLDLHFYVQMLMGTVK